MKQLLFSISYVPRDGESTLDEIEEQGTGALNGDGRLEEIAHECCKAKGDGSAGVSLLKGLAPP